MAFAFFIPAAAALLFKMSGLLPSNFFTEYMTHAGVVWFLSLLALGLADRFRSMRLEKEAAEKADKLKSIFLASMSHELRTPLNSVIGFADLALEEKISARVREYPETVKSSGAFLLNLIGDIIDISKAESAQLEISKRSCSSREMFDDIGAGLEPSLRRKNVELREKRPEKIESFIGDPTKIRQILHNLLRNALKFTDEGFIEYGACLKDKDTLLFYVRDTGIGVPAEKLEEIFKPFQQAHDYSTFKYRGSGLGLAISEKLANMMGGKLWCESKTTGEGRGSTFYFSLPYEAAGESEEKDHLMTETLQLYGIQKALLADDDPGSLKLAKLILGKTGIEVSAVSNGLEAVEIFKRNGSIDVIVMDIEMPKMNGIEAASEIRRLEKAAGARRTPIIALTAAAMKGDKEKCLKAGCDDYLTKPLKQDALKKALLKYLTSGTLPE